MASLLDWIKEHVFKQTIKDGEIADVPFNQDGFNALIKQGAAIQKMAFNQCVTLIANAISQCEFKTYLNGREVFENEYYLLNISPNLNETAPEFIHKLITKLLENGEALAVSIGTRKNEQLIVADDFQIDQTPTQEAVFKNITLYGAGTGTQMILPRDYRRRDVLYFRLPAGNVKQWSDAFLLNYQKLLNYAMSSFLKSRGTHAILKFNAQFAGDPEKQKKLSQVYQRYYKQFVESESSVWPLDNGVDFQEISQKTYTNDNSRDIRALADDVRDITAQAFNIPITLINGSVEGTADALDYFLTFCIDPLADMIEKELTARRDGKVGFMDGTKIKIDTSTIKHTDVLSAGESIDKLVSSGVYSINQIRRKLGEDQINEDFADKYYITKNYMTVEEVNNEQALFGNDSE